MLQSNKRIVGEVLEPLRNRDHLDLLSKRVHRLWVSAKALVSRELLGQHPEGFLMALEDRLGKLAVRDLLAHHIVLGDEALARLAQKDHVSELDGFVTPAALDQLGVVLEDAEDPVFCR